MKLVKKAQVGNLQGFILAIVSVGIVLAIGLIVLGQLQVTQIDTSITGCGTNISGGSTGTLYYVNCSEAYSSTGQIITKLGTVPTWIGIIIVVALAFIVLGFFYGRSRM